MTQITLDSAPIQVRAAAERAREAQLMAGREAEISSVTALQTPRGWEYTAVITSRSRFGASRSETAKHVTPEGPRQVAQQRDRVIVAPMVDPSRVDPEPFRAALYGQAEHTPMEHTRAEWDELLRQTRAFL
ncbi:MAG: hypothetical protein RBU21_10245 [FCB group bacterium]|jgi:hypothetical protein|nr:hypothetical protein [FCB group bacterium]